MKQNEALVVFQEKVDSQGKGIPYHLDVFLERGVIREQVGTFYQTKSGLPREKIAQAIYDFSLKRGVEGLVFSEFTPEARKLSSPSLAREVKKYVSLQKELTTRLEELSFTSSPTLLDENRQAPCLTPSEVDLFMKLDPFNPVYLNVHEDNLARYCAELAELGYYSIETHVNKNSRNNFGRHIIGVRPDVS